MRVLKLMYEIGLKELRQHAGYLLGIAAASVMFALISRAYGGAALDANAASVGFFSMLAALGMGYQTIEKERKNGTLAFTVTKPIAREWGLVLKGATGLLLVFLAILAGAGILNLLLLFLSWRGFDVAAFCVGWYESTRLFVLSTMFYSLGMMSALWQSLSARMFGRQPLILLVLFVAFCFVSSLDVFEGVPYYWWYPSAALLTFGASLGLVREFQLET